MAHIKFARANTIRSHYTSALRSAYTGHEIFDPDYATEKDTEIWDKLRRDTEIAGMIERRLIGVASADPIITPVNDSDANKFVADLMTQIVSMIHKFHMSRKQLAKAIFRGDAWAGINGSRQKIKLSGDGSPRNWWICNKLVDIDRNRFRQVVDDEIRAKENRIKTMWEIFSFNKDTMFDDWTELGVQRTWFARVVYDDGEEGLGYGRGIMQAMYYYARAKAVALADGLDGLKRWAQGLLKVAVDVDEVGEEADDTITIRDEYIDQLKIHLAQHILVHTKGDEIDVVEWSGKGHELVMTMIKYFDNSLRRLVLMSVLPTGGGEGDVGSYGRAQTEETQQTAVFQFDQRTMYEDLTKDLLGLLWRLNFPMISQAVVDRGFDMDEVRMPRFIPLNEEILKPEEQVQIIQGALQNGIPLKKDEVYERLGFTVPAEEDEVFETSPLQAQDPFGGGFPGGGLFQRANQLSGNGHGTESP